MHDPFGSTLQRALLCAAFLLALPAAHAQRDEAAFDMTGYWVSVITEDWKFRMVTPARGVYDGIPLNAAGREFADNWNPAADRAAGEACKAFGAAAIMRMPGRLRIDWQNESTLRIDTDAGRQTRFLRFGDTDDSGGERTWQGQSKASWVHAPGQGPGSEGSRAGDLKVVTTHLRAGYLRRNGVPYSENAVVTEYYNRLTAPNGDTWLIITTVVDDPEYLTRHYVTSSNFKRIRDESGWNPTDCDMN